VTSTEDNNTKGKIVREGGEDIYYFLVSSKRAV